MIKKYYNDYNVKQYVSELLGFSADHFSIIMYDVVEGPFCDGLSSNFSQKKLRFLHQQKPLDA